MTGPTWDEGQVVHWMSIEPPAATLATLAPAVASSVRSQYVPIAVCTWKLRTVTGDLVDVAVHAGVNVAVVKAFGAAPLDHLGRGGLVLERRVVGSVWGSIDADGREMAMGADRGSESADKGSSLDLVRHVDGR
jgi:hypothetical protein